MSITLKNRVVGFIKDHDKDSFVSDCRKLRNNIDFHFFKPLEAIRLVDPDNQEHGVSKGILRSIQKQIGGGPSEFLRDIKTMDSDELLLTFEYHPHHDSDDLLDLKKIFQVHNVRQAKYFGLFAVEHLTLDPDHRAEIPAFNA